MKNEIKILTTVTLILMGSYVFASDRGEWSTDNVSSYKAGDMVSIDGKTYKCKSWPQSGWCKSSSYKPNGLYGADAWDEVSNPNPQPNPDPQPNPGPNPTPQPNLCGDIPNDVKEFIPQGPQNWSGYSKNAYVKFQGAIYKLTDWWTASSPEKDPDWKLCQDSAPQEQGTLSITINKPSFTLESQPEIIIFKLEGDKKIEIAKASDVEFGKAINIPVNIGELEVFIPSINGSNAIVDPATISLKKGETKTINVNFQAPAPIETGQLEVTFEGAVAPKESVHYTISDSQGHVVRNGHTDFSSALKFDDLPASDKGTTYIISFDSYSQDGYIYKADDKAIEVFKHNLSKVNFSFKAEQLATQKVAINVSGLPKDKKATITLVSSKGQTREIELTGDKSQYNIEVPIDGATWSFTVSSLVGFSSILSQNSFVADPQQTNHRITLEFKEKSSSTTNWPDRVIVGYVRGYDAPWYSQPDTTNDMIQQAMDHGYNVIVYAFAGQKPNGEVYLPKWTEQMKDKVPSQINIIHNNNGIALLSIGGAVNYFDPDMSGDKAIPTGKAMGKYLADNGYDGLDIDVEHPNASSSIEENFIRYINAARAEFKSITGKDMYLAAAPQISGWYGTGQWASGSAKFAEPMYTQKFMDDADFDAVFIQTYNQYGGANFGGLKGFDVGFLTMTFNLLSPETRNQMNGVPANSFYIPEDTKIVLGVPDFKDPAISESQYQTGSCLATAMCSGAGLYDPVDISKDIKDGGLEQHNQYGGLMTWILNSDSYQGWTWVDGVKGVVYK
jgi:chitinase